MNLITTYLETPRHVPTIAVVGGPESGKSSVLRHLAQHLTVHTVPEVASCLLPHLPPCAPTFDTWIAPFQHAVLGVQLPLELIAHAHAEQDLGLRAVVTDRGAPDLRAYLPAHLPLELVTGSFSLQDLGSRYDHVLYLESMSENGSLSKANNDQRYEASVEEARELSLRTREAWQSACGNRITFLPIFDTLEAKLEAALEIVQSWLNVEHERRWVLTQRPDVRFEGSETLQQGYLNPGSRVRITENSAELVVKTGSGALRRQLTTALGREAAEQLLAGCTPKFTKTREYLAGNPLVTLDTYQDGTLILEAESRHAEVAPQLPFALPAGSNEVTEEPQYNAYHIGLRLCA